MPKTSKEIYEFGGFRLDVAERRLSRNGRPVRLADKAFDTLCTLVRHQGELVTKEQLLDSVWPDAAVEENNLDQKISLLRRVLGERGRKEKFIETVRGHGYRFTSEAIRVADGPCELSGVPPEHSRYFQTHETTEEAGPVARRVGNLVALSDWNRRNTLPAPKQPVIRPETGGEFSEDEWKKPQRAARGRRMITMAAAAGILLLAAWGIYSYVAPTIAGAPIESIAILPVSNRTGDPSYEYLSDGLTESMISGISQVPGLSVKARNSVFRYKGQDAAPEAVGRELSVQSALFGTLTISGDELVLRLELVDTRSGNVLWTERYDHKPTDVIALQREIVGDVSSKLRSRLSDSEKGRIARSYTADPEANRLYFQARYHLNKRTPEDIKRSIALFGQAAQKDPKYARAFAGLSEAHIILPDYSPGFSRSEVKIAEQLFRAAFLRARELDDSLPEVQALAAVHSEVDWDVPGADRAYRKAIELDPNFASARHWYSRFLGAVGRNDEAIEQINKALQLDPFSRSIAFNLGARYLDARRFDEAIAQLNRVLEMEPGHSLTHYALGLAYDAKQRHREATEEFRIAANFFDPGNSAAADKRAGDLIAALESGGPEGYWRKRLEYSRLDYDAGIGSNFKIAVCLARMSRTDAALDHLERSFTTREPDLFWVRTDSAFDRFQSDLRFLDLLRRIGVG